MFKIMKRMIYFIPWVLYSLIIIYLSHQERVEFIDTSFVMGDKILHFLGYFFYGLTIQFALINSTNYKDSKFFITVIIIGSIFGASDEFHQYFISGRSSELLDWLADTLGVASSLLLKNIILWLKNRINIVFNNKKAK